MNVFLWALLALLIACSNPFSNGDCVAVGVAGINATVTERATNQAPEASPTMTIVDGSYQELGTLLVGSNPPRLLGAIERPGNYRVVVHASGYRDFTQDSVAVTRGGACNSIRSMHLGVQLDRIER